MASKSPRVALPKIQPLPDGAHKRAGRFDGAKRWAPLDLYRVAGTFHVRGPSRAWPFSYLKHFYTGTYARALAAVRPDLYLSLAGIAPDSETGRGILAVYAAQRLEGGEA